MRESGSTLSGCLRRKVFRVSGVAGLVERGGLWVTSYLCDPPWSKCEMRGGSRDDDSDA